MRGQCRFDSFPRVNLPTRLFGRFELHVARELVAYFVRRGGRRLFDCDPEQLRFGIARTDDIRHVLQQTLAGLTNEETTQDRHARLMLPRPEVVESYGIKDPMLRALINMLCDYTRRRLPPAPAG